MFYNNESPVLLTWSFCTWASCSRAAKEILREEKRPEKSSIQRVSWATSSMSLTNCQAILARSWQYCGILYLSDCLVFLALICVCKSVLQRMFLHDCRWGEYMTGKSCHKCPCRNNQARAHREVRRSIAAVLPEDVVWRQRSSDSKSVPYGQGKADMRCPPGKDLSGVSQACWPSFANTLTENKNSGSATCRKVGSPRVKTQGYISSVRGWPRVRDFTKNKSCGCPPVAMVKEYGVLSTFDPVPAFLPYY